MATKVKAYHHDLMWTARLLIGAAALMVVLTVAAVPVLFEIGGDAAAWAVLLMFATVILACVAASHSEDAGLYFDYGVQRTFRGVCRSKNLARPNDQGRLLYPRFYKLLGSDEAWQARIRPLTGQSMRDFMRVADAFYTAYGSKTVRFTDNGDGTFMMRVGFLAGEPVTADLPTTDMQPEYGQTWRDVLARIPVGRYVLGSRNYRMPVIDTQILVAGVTGAGKGSVIWSTLVALVPVIRSGIVRVSGLDPKRNELSIGQAFFQGGYAASDDDMVALLERKVAEMQARAEAMAGKMRKFIPTPDMPLELIVIDELAYLTSYVVDRKKREAIAKLMATLLSQGRSAGFCVLAAVQDPRVETVPFRDLFPTRIGMKLPAGMIDIILGAGSKEAGAACNEIRRKVDAGMAFVISEESDIPEQVRFNWASDELIKEAAQLLESADAA